MTPILMGRWQTRLWLTGYIGIPVTFFFGLLYQDMRVPFLLLSYLTLMGLVLDCVYNLLQKRRWDRDWSPLLHTLTGIFEGGVLWVLAYMGLLPGIRAEGITLERFWLHYGTTWLLMFIVLWCFMKIFFIQWRFRGGRILTQ